MASRATCISRSYGHVPRQQMPSGFSPAIKRRAAASSVAPVVPLRALPASLHRLVLTTGETRQHSLTRHIEWAGPKARPGTAVFRQVLVDLVPIVDDALAPREVPGPCPARPE